MKHRSAMAMVMVLTGMLLTTILIGCTTMRRDQAAETTTLLSQAGFKVIKADTPERVAKLNTLTPYKVVPWKRKTGGTVYAYAEPKDCKCVYVGSPKQYAKYQQLLGSEQVSAMAAQETAWSEEPEEFSDSTIEAGG